MKYCRWREQWEEKHCQLMQEQMLDALRVHQPTVKHVNMAPFEESEDIQDFLEAFEGIMSLQKVDRSELVLCLALWLKRKAWTVSTDVRTIIDYEGVRKAILSQYRVSPERCWKGYCTHTWTRDAEPNAWIAKGKKLMNWWLLPEEGMQQVLDKIVLEQFINA